MNKEHLAKVFANYMEKFEVINSPKCDENYKWRIAYQFHDLVDPEHPDFPQRLKAAARLSANLIDGGNRYCFSALVTCAEKEPNAVRVLYRELFAEDHGDLTLRQGKITRFIHEANRLTERLVSSNNMFMNDQRSAMAYLFFNDPDNHYLYKASEARDFASCVEFYDDWGSGEHFKLDVYYRMCDMIVEGIRNDSEMIRTHMSRYMEKDDTQVSGMHPDNNYHILVFDIIYGAPAFRYNFYKGIPYETITAEARKLHLDRVEKARRLQVELSEAQTAMAKVLDAETYFRNLFSIGMQVRHKMFGSGEVVSVDDDSIAVLFSRKNEVKSLRVMTTVLNGFLVADDSNFSDMATVLKNKHGVQRQL